MNELIKAKVELYSLLLKMNEDALSDNDADLMYTLSKDRDIQKVLRDKIDQDHGRSLCGG